MVVLLKKHRLRVGMTLLALYGVFLMDLGGRSFANHVVRILKTPESRELGSELVGKATDAASGARRRAMLALGPSHD
jgi:hypothetical protein